MRGSSWEVNYDGKWYPAKVAGTYTIPPERYALHRPTFLGQAGRHPHRVRPAKSADPLWCWSSRTPISSVVRYCLSSAAPAGVPSSLSSRFARCVAARRCARHLRAERAHRRPGPPSLRPSYQSHLAAPLYHEEAVKLLQSAAYYAEKDQRRGPPQRPQQQHKIQQ